MPEGRSEDSPLAKIPRVNDEQKSRFSVIPERRRFTVSDIEGQPLETDRQFSIANSDANNAGNPPPSSILISNTQEQPSQSRGTLIIGDGPAEQNTSTRRQFSTASDATPSTFHRDSSTENVLEGGTRISEKTVYSHTSTEGGRTSSNSDALANLNVTNFGVDENRNPASIEGAAEFLNNTEHSNCDFTESQIRHVHQILFNSLHLKTTSRQVLGAPVCEVIWSSGNVLKCGQKIVLKVRGSSVWDEHMNVQQACIVLKPYRLISMNSNELNDGDGRLRGVIVQALKSAHVGPRLRHLLRSFYSEVMRKARASNETLEASGKDEEVAVEERTCNDGDAMEIEQENGSGQAGTREVPQPLREADSGQKQTIFVQDTDTFNDDIAKPAAPKESRSDRNRVSARDAVFAEAEAALQSLAGVPGPSAADFEPVDSSLLPPSIHSVEFTEEFGLIPVGVLTPIKAEVVMGRENNALLLLKDTNGEYCLMIARNKDHISGSTYQGYATRSTAKLTALHLCWLMEWEPGSDFVQPWVPVLEEQAAESGDPIPSR